MNWSHSFWGLAGQIMALWISSSILIAAAWSGFRAWQLRRCRRRNMIRILTEHAERQALLHRQRENLIMADAIAGQKDNAFLERARKAESLGFIDPDEAGPYVA